MPVQLQASAYILFVKDMAKLSAFYVAKLGLKRLKNRHYPESQWLELRAGPGFKLCLHAHPKPGSPRGNRNKLVFQVADVGAARAALRSAGVKLGEHKRWPGGDACDGRDPEGNAFQLQGPPTRK